MSHIDEMIELGRRWHRDRDIFYFGGAFLGFVLGFMWGYAW